MKKRCFNLLFVLMFLISSIASADTLGNFNKQDLSYPVPDTMGSYMAKRAPMPQQLNIYLGLGGGAAVTTLKPTVQLVPGDPAYTNTSHPDNYQAEMYGGIGTNLDHFYLGAEISGQATTLYKRIALPDNFFPKNDSLTIREPAAIALDFIPGYLTQKRNILIYGRIGAALGWFQFKMAAESPKDPNQTIANTSMKTAAGVHAGLGIEFFIGDNFSIRTEYIYTNFANMSGKYTPSGYARTYTYKVSPSVNQINLGIGFHF